MNISLSPELEQFINHQIESGLYTTANEVISESLKLLSNQETLQSLRTHRLDQAIDIGLHASAIGEKFSAKESYDRLKKKIDNISKVI